MSSKSRGAGTSKDVPPAKLVQTVLEATSCSEEEAKQMLLDCNNDCNEAVNRLLDGGAFAAVINKKQRRKQKEDERKKEVPAKVLEVRRQPSASPAPRERARGVRGGERLSSRGSRSKGASAGADAVLSTDETLAPAAAAAAGAAHAGNGDWDDAPSTSDPATSKPAIQSPVGTPASLQAALPPPVAQAARAGWGAGAQGSMSMAERLRQLNPDANQQRAGGALAVASVGPPPGAPPPQQQPQPAANQNHVQDNVGGSPPIPMHPSSRAVGAPVSASSPLVTASDWDVPAPVLSTSSKPTGSLAPGGIAGPIEPQMGGGMPGLGGVAVQPPARQMPIPAPFHNDPPAGAPGGPLQHAGSWQPKGAGPPHAPVGSGGSSFAASLAPGPPSQQHQQQQLHQQQPASSSATASPLLSSDPALASHAPSPHGGGLAQQLGAVAPSVSQGGELQPSLLHTGAPPHHQHQQHQQQQQQHHTSEATDHLGIQFGQMQFSSSSFGGATGGFGGSYSESPAFGDGPPTSSFSEPSTSAFGPGAVPVLSTNESLASNAGANGVLSHEGSGLAVGGASFKTAGPPGGPTAASPSGHAADDFAQPGASQRSGSIGLPATSSAVPGGGQYSAFAQPKAQEPPQSHSSAGQYSQYGYNQQFGGSAAFGQTSQYGSYGSASGSFDVPPQQTQYSFPGHQPQPSQQAAPGYGHGLGAPSGAPQKPAAVGSDYGAARGPSPTNKFGAPQTSGSNQGDAQPASVSQGMHGHGSHGGQPAPAAQAPAAPPTGPQQQQQSLQQGFPPNAQMSPAMPAGFESAGYGYGGYSPYGYNMSAGPGFYAPGGYAAAPPGYGYPQYGQPPVGGGAFQQAGGYGGAQPHLGGGGSAGKYGGAGYGVPGGGYGGKDLKEGGGGGYGGGHGAAGQQHQQHMLPPQQQAAPAGLPRDAYPSSYPMPGGGGAAAFGGQQFGGQYGGQYGGGQYGGGHAGNGPAPGFKMQ